MSKVYDEIVIFEGIAERTGNTTERRPGPGRTFCSSMSQLASISRRRGDGLYYLEAGIWPDETSSADLNDPWVTLSASNR